MAIGIVLGILFCALLIGAVILAIVMFYKNSDEGGHASYLTTAILSTVAAVGFFFCFLFIPFSYHQVDAGEVAVVKHLGEIRDVRTAGTYFDFWVTEKYEKYDAKVQNVQINTSTYSNDAQTMDVSMTVQYQINIEHIKEIASIYGSLDVLNNRIESVAVDAMKSVMAGHTANEIIKDRASVSPKVTEAVKSVIDGSYYVNVNTVVLTNIDFTDAYEAAVEAEMIAEREKNAALTKAEQEKEIAIKQAEAKVEVARQEVLAAEQQAAAKIAAAEGDAIVQRTIAAAEAYATQKKIAELARSFGYEVIETEDTIEINWESTGKPDEVVTAEKAAILSYLQYLEYLATWNGELPEVVAGDSGFMITLPSAGENND